MHVKMAFSSSVTFGCILLTLFMCSSNVNGSCSGLQNLLTGVDWCKACGTCGGDCSMAGSQNCTCLAEYASGIIIGLIGLQLITLLIVCVETCYICCKCRKEKKETHTPHSVEVVDSVAAEHIAGASSSSGALDLIETKTRDPDSRNEPAVYSECNLRPRSSTADATLLYSYACVHTSKEEGAEFSSHKGNKGTNRDVEGSTYATVVDSKSDSERGGNVYRSTPHAQGEAIKTPPMAMLPIKEEEERHMYSTLETNTVPQPQQMTNSNFLFLNEKQTKSPTVPSFQLSQKDFIFDPPLSPPDNNKVTAYSFGLHTLPIEEQLYDTSKRTEF